MADERGDRRVNRERDAGLGAASPSLAAHSLVHPEAALEVELARRVAAGDEELDRLLGDFSTARARGRIVATR